MQKVICSLYEGNNEGDKSSLEKINIWEEEKIELQRKKKEFDNKIVLMGIGGTGLNFINREIENPVVKIDFVGVDTDKKCLEIYKGTKNC